MVDRKSLLNQLNSLSKDVYCREELLGEMDSLKMEMANIVYSDNSFSINDHIHMSNIIKHLYCMNNLAGNKKNYELDRFAKLSKEFENQIRAKQSGIIGEEKAFSALQRMKSNKIILRNLQLSDGDRNTEIDFLVLKQGVATIVEVKNTKRDVFIDSKGDLYKIGKYEIYDSCLGEKMEFRAKLIKQYLEEIGYTNMKIEKVVVFTNKYIQIQKDYFGFKVCFLSRLPYMIDEFYGTGVIQFTKHLQQMADYIQSKDVNKYYPFEMDIKEYKEIFVEAYIKAMGFEESKNTKNVFSKVKCLLQNFINKQTMQQI